MDAPTLIGTSLVLRPIREADVETLWELITSPEVSRWWKPAPRDEQLAEWLAGEEAIQWTIVVAGAPAGLIQAHEELDPEFRHAGIDLFLGPSYHGRGLGRDSIRTVARWLLDDRGHHRLIIDPALANERAIRCYEGVGFRRVGVMRRYWLDHTTGEWVDGLLLDLLCDELA